MAMLISRILRQSRLGPGIGALVAAVLALTVPAAAETRPDPVKVSADVDRGRARLTLDWPRPVTYSVERSGNYVFVRFAKPFVADLEPVSARLSRYVSELRSAGAGRVLVIRVLGQPRFAHERRGNAVVLTWVGAGVTPPAGTPTDSKAPPAASPKRLAERPMVPPVPADAAPSAGPPAAAPRAAAPRLAEAPSLVRPPAAMPPPAAEPPPAVASPPVAAAPPVPPAPPAAAVPRAAPPDATVAPIPPAAVAPLPERGSPPASRARLDIAASGGETRIVAAWPEPVGAAVFRFGEYIWVVFARPERFDLVAAQYHLGPGIERVTQTDHRLSTVLMFKVAPEITARATRDGATWTVRLRRGAPPPAEGDVKLVVVLGGGERVAAPLTGAEAPLRVTDPATGATLDIVPSRNLAALGAERRFVVFRLVPAVQGAVIEVLADGLQVTAENGGIVVRRPGGLLISTGTPPGGAAYGQ